MKKKLTIAITAVIAIVGLVLIYNKTSFKAEDIVLTWNEKDTFEYGDKVNVEDLVEECSGTMDVVTPLDTMKVGKQVLKVKVTERNKTRDFEKEFQIVDTKYPHIVLKEKTITINKGDHVDISRYIESVKDDIDGNLPYKKWNDIQKGDTHYYSFDPTPHDKSYTVTIVAVDKNGLKSEQSIKVNVKVPPTETHKNETTVKPSSKPVVTNNKVIVIDPGHQGKANLNKEAIGPGSSTVKNKVTAGAAGESQVNLKIGLLLRDELKRRGYTVIMTRTSQNVNISNQQRAQIGNKNKAGAVIHLHCDGAGSSARGAHTIAPAKNNPYCPSIYQRSSSLAQTVIQSYCQATGIKNRGVSYRNDLTGLNWSQVPAIYIEMGFLSNPTENKLLHDASFQKKAAKGIADGLDRYFH